MGMDDVSETVAGMRHEVIDELVKRHIPERAYAEQWDAAGLREALNGIFGLDLPVDEWAAEEGIADQEIQERVTKAADAKAARKAARWSRGVRSSRGGAWLMISRKARKSSSRLLAR